MNFRFAFLLVSILVMSSCKRDFASFQRSTYQGGNFTKSKALEIPEEENNVVNGSVDKEAVIAEKKNSSVSKESKSSELNKTKKKIATLKSLRETKQEIKKLTKTTKDRDPRYTRALLMTVFGGIATALGILAFSVAPTGLFIFVFGVIFLIGLVSLLMYWANPKPSM